MNKNIDSIPSTTLKTLTVDIVREYSRTGELYRTGSDPYSGHRS